MAIVALTGTVQSWVTLSRTLDQVPQHGGMNVVTSTVEVGAADSDTSTYFMARLPSAARLQPQSCIGLDDLASAGAPTLDVGTQNLADGTADDPDSLRIGARRYGLSLVQPVIRAA